MLTDHERYFSLLKKKIDKIRAIDIHRFADMLSFSKMIWIIGNGGSCSSASHFAEDLCKSAGIKAIALTDPSLITASANDCGYENSFYTGLKILVSSDDAIVGISVSGESKNILQAFRLLKCRRLALVGVKDSSIDRRADFSIAVGSGDFKLVEDVHAILCHRIVAEMEKRRNINSKD